MIVYSFWLMAESGLLTAFYCLNSPGETVVSPLDRL